MAPVVAAAPVHVWETVEITLPAAEIPADPYAGERVWVDLEGPGFSKRCHAFWDGGDTFRVRVQATAPGVWTWRSGSEIGDARLSGQSGTFEALPWTEAEKQANPNRRGQVRIAPDGRHFEYADGTPFFLLADTLWAGNTARCSLGDNGDGRFHQYLADRRAKGFTAVLMQYIHGYGDYPNGQAHRNEGGYAFADRDPARLHPAYFQALDRRMQALGEAGFVVAVPTMWWGKTKKCLFAPEQARRISVYCAARYGTFNALWSLSGEYQYTFADCGWTPADFSALGAAVQRHNPWGHPLSIHPSARTDWKPPHNSLSSSPFHGEAWLDHHWLQTGQSVDRLFNIVPCLTENRALIPAAPVFCSEACYERASDRDSAYHARWQVWTSLLNGAAGYGYGAHGVWQFLDPADPQGETGKVTAHPPVPWREALRLPGSAQVRHARTLLESLDWWNLQPRRHRLRVDGRVNGLPTATDLTPPHAASTKDGTWVVYVPRGNQKREIVLDAPTAANHARWFDPRRGAFAGPAVSWSGETRTLPARPAPADEDWVLIAQDRQYILLNRTPGAVSRESFQEVKRALPDVPGARIRVGVGYIFSYFRAADDTALLASLRSVLQWAQETDTPVLIQLDGEQWWEGRPDLWNWWEGTPTRKDALGTPVPSRPGFDPANRENVEWSGWTPEHALKIAWRNWGRQLRVLPPPNLMSPRYRQACHEKMALLVPVVLDWWKALPAGKEDLFVGLKVGWESSVGVNAWYYPNGNALLDQPADQDPTSGLKSDEPPARGVAPIGYAAVKTAGLRTSGELTESDLAEVARRHLEDLSHQAAQLGVPRDRLFTHGAGWKDGELLYRAAVNEFSCPGWSFYRHAADPRKDLGVQEALKTSDAPYWAATEWLYPGPKEVASWRQALDRTLEDRRCRYVCIYNWEGIRGNESALEAIRQTVAAGAEKPQ